MKKIMKSKKAKAKKLSEGVKIKSNSIKNRLKKIKMSQKELAVKCNVSPQHISAIINSKKTGVTLSLAHKIALHLGQSIEQTFTL